MAKAKPQPISFTRIVSGIADYDKESVQTDGVAMIRQIDYRSNPRKWTLLPRTVKESGSVITGLPLWGDRIDTDAYIVDDAGSIYKRTSAGTTTLQRAVSSSHGNGIKFFGEDSFLYYPSDKVIGRYGRIGSSPSWTDDFLGAQGGVPTNTASLDLESSSSRYATAADSATTSITGDLAIEVNFMPESLPTTGAEMVLLSKWNENSNKRSYKLSIYAVSGYFGDGSDGTLTISSDTTEAPIDSACSGTSGTNSLTATNASFAANQIVLIMQMTGASAGTWQRNKIASYTAGTITLENNLNFSYTTGAQVRVLKQYTTVTINSAKTYTVKAWNGTVGGILAWIANVSSAITGTITASGSNGTSGGDGVAGATGGGFRGGSGKHSNPSTANSGEGTTGASVAQTAANGNGGGGGATSGPSAGCGGGGGGNGGTGGGGSGQGTGGTGGGTSGTNDLTTMTMGGGGGGGANDGSEGGNPIGSGGSGGGIIFLTSVDITVHASTGNVTANGGNGGNAASNPGEGSAGGAGAGGSILFKVQTATLNTTRVTATGGTGGINTNTSTQYGGNGGTGRVHIDYLTSYTGTTSPTIDAAQDNSLVTTTTYQLQLQLSNDGTAEETLSKNLSSIATSIWGHYAISWDASDHQAEFFENGVSLGSATGAFTSLNDNTSLMAIGASFNSSGSAENFADGLFDDVRLWGAERTAAQILGNKETELVGTEVGLNGYWQLDSSTSDSTANSNNLTLVNSPVYSSTVAFVGATTRLDIDQQDTNTGDTYAVPQAIDEGASHRQTFVPAKDPQKSIGIYISDTGDDSDWTIYVHDAQNRLIASKTLTHAQLTTGHNEFVFDNVWRPILGATYHFHVVASTSTGTPLLVSDSSNNLETGQFNSYYQFLVEDIYHPAEQILNMLAIGNERYLAVWDASSYNPHRLTFPSGWRVRCISQWREYWAIGCWKGSAVTDYDEGIIFFWDGISTTYNFFIKVPEGAINAMLGAQGTLYIVAGYQGDILEYNGGDKAVKVKRLPKITPDKYIEVLPGAMTMWRTLVHIGAGVTNSTDVEQGAYSWGSLNRNYVDSLSFDYKISTGTTQSTSMKIGLLMPVQTKLLMGWKDNVSYGLDVVDPAGSVYPSGSIEWLISDDGGIWKEKKPDTIRADFDTLISGHSVGIQYKLNRASDWSTEETASYDSDPEGQENEVLRVQPNIDDLGSQVRHREYQVRLNLATSNSTSPGALGVTIMEDLLTDEEFV